MQIEETANFFLLYEVFDDIAMEADPRNLWERDQVKTFVDGTNLEGDNNIVSFNWSNNDETYGKLRVSRYNTFEGNVAKMTDDTDVWDEGFGANISSLSATAEMETNADYRIEFAVSLIPMIDDENFVPFFDTPTEEAGHIVADSTRVKFTAAATDGNNFSGPGTERFNVLVY